MRTFRPSRASVNGIWQDRREVASRSSLESSRSSSSAVSGGISSANAGSTWTWQVAHEQQPPQRASSSSNPLSRIASITVRPAWASTSRVSPERVVTISLGMRVPFERRAATNCGPNLQADGERVREEDIVAGIDAVAARDPRIAAALERVGYPGPRLRERGYRTLLRTIVGQQVSVAAAARMWRKLEATLGEDMPAAALLAAEFDALRACGLSRQKQGYARSLCELVVSGELDLENLPPDDEEAIAELVRIKGIGRWSAEIYLLFAEGRPDIWPAGDLAVQIEIGRLLGDAERPTEKRVREVAEPWRPHRGAAAIFAWHHYKVDMEVI